MKKAFCWLVALEICYFLWVFLSHRIPAGHDGLTYFLCQYFFLNDTVASGQVPQWIPYVGHGADAAFWFAFQAGIGQKLMFWLAPGLKALNFNAIFCLNVFMDQMVLLVGSWLLCEKYYRTRAARFFVVAALSGTAIWPTQMHFNFHFYYCLPLVMYFFHRFCDTLRWRYFLGAGNLLALQTLGNTVYLLPVAAFVVFVYASLYTVLTPAVLSGIFKRNRPTIVLLCLAAVAVSFALAAAVLIAGSHDVVYYSLGRGQSQEVPLRYFLLHGGNLDLHKWLELLTGVSPALDFTLYSGVLTLAFLIPGFKECWRSPHRGLIYTSLVILLFASGTVISAAVYCVWPFMKLYRHLALVAPVLKMFLVFIAGFGFESWAQALKAGDEGKARGLNTVLLALLVVASFLLFSTLLKPGHLTRYEVDPGGLFFKDGRVHLVPGLPVLPHQSGMEFPRLLKIFLLLLLVHYGTLRLKTSWRFVIVFVLFVHVFDVYEYKVFQTLERTVQLSGRAYDLLRFVPPQYSPRRLAALSQAHDARSRFLRTLPDRNGTPHAIYDSFAFADTLGSGYQIDYLQKNMDLYLRAVGHQDFADRSEPPKGVTPYVSFDFPATSGWALGMSGYRDKIQFYNEPVFLNQDQEVFEALAALKDDEEPLLVKVQGTAAGATTTAQSLHWPGRYQVTGFSANRLEFDADLESPGGAAGQGWVLISQANSRNWRATVNGTMTRIYPADLAYQALPLPVGPSHVRLVYDNRPLFWLYEFWILLSLVWILIVLGYAGALIKGRYAGEAL